MSKTAFSLAILIFSFSVLFSNGSILAQNGEDQCVSGPCCNTTVDPNEFYDSNHPCDWGTEYSCYAGTNCGADFYQNNWVQYCSGNSEQCTGIIKDNWSVSESCQPWERCTSSGCQCDGMCLTTPTGPYPSDGAKNVKLPVTLMWNGVNGAKSYRYEIEGVLEGVTTTSYITIGGCKLKSNKSYNWRVRACCDLEGTSCGPWSNFWTFETSLAPELLSPENNANNIPLPVTFDWCDVEEAQSYCLRVFYKETGKEISPPWLILKEEGFLPSEFSLGLDWLTKNTSYDWEVATCLNEDGTKCGLNCQEDQNCSECGENSQKWNFNIISELKTPKLVAPKSENDPPIVNLSSQLEWEGIKGALSYRYRIKKGENKIVNSSSSLYVVSFNSFWDNLEFNTIYSWQVKSCWDDSGESCEEGWSEEWKFKTTGAPPINLKESPKVEGNKISIPANLSWNKMPGALSYRYEIASDKNFNNLLATGTTLATKSEISIEYPILKQKTKYFWRVSTCADENGEVCGKWSESDFTTFELSPPTNPYPKNNGEFLTSENYLRWEGTAKYYQYKVDYQGTEKIPLTIVYSKSAFIPTNEFELGKYTWWVRACLDKNCQETSKLAGPWHFNLVQEKCEKGLIPCGRGCDVLETPYDERKPCQFKHIFLLLNNILDFLLWRLGLIIMVLLTVTTGVIYYFSMGVPQTMAKVKSLLKSAGIGYLIILLSWLIINWILIVLGYQVEFFGHWWQISF